MRIETRRRLIYLVLIAIALVVPLTGNVYYTRLATQIAIYGMAAASVDLLLGYTGLITFGQAAFLGIGAYTAGILIDMGVTNALLAWPLAIVVSAGFAVLIGALCVRTSGFQFIMVTLAFAQMFYYIAQSLRAYGGDNGFALPQRNDLGPLSLHDHVVFYYVCLALLLVVLWIASHLVASQFGMVIRGVRDNERRVAALGLPPLRYKLVVFAIAGAIAGFAGALLANNDRFISPNILTWQLSGSLLAMVILGSTGTLIGPVIGAAIYLLFQQFLSDYTEHWMLFFGLLLLARVLLAREGLWGLLLRLARADDARRTLASTIGAAQPDAPASEPKKEPTGTAAS